MQVIETKHKPIFSWCPNVEQSALDQIRVIAELPFVTHCAIMPDAHFGMSMPIGGVAATNGVIVPNWVGVDAGCGVGSIKTSLKASELSIDEKKKLLHSFTRSIPTGFNHNSKKRVEELKEKYNVIIDKYCNELYNNPIGTACNEVMTFKPIQDTEKSVYEQLATLGGGNHFCELQKDENDNVWVMIHSGSRNIGKTICDYFHELAKNENKRWYSNVPEDVGFLPVNTPMGLAYIKWMNFALSFAFLNRQVMLDSIKKDISHMYPNTEYSELINIHHNFAAIEHHFGKDVWVHRKGATKAVSGMKGIIPGSMGTCSYIVNGKSNPQSLNSCSHGAGRVSSRTEFNKKMNTDDGIKAIESSMEGIVHSEFQKEKKWGGKETGQLDVSEAPQAYKNIEEVIQNELDLIEPIVKLYPIINMKG